MKNNFNIMPKAKLAKVSKKGAMKLHKLGRAHNWDRESASAAAKKSHASTRARHPNHYKEMTELRRRLKELKRRDREALRQLEAKPDVAQQEQ